MSPDALSDSDCPIKPGLMVWHLLWGWIPTWSMVREVGELVRVGGGWVAPVRFGSGKYGLVRCFVEKDIGTFTVYRILKVDLQNGNCACLLRDSTTMPRVVHGGDPGTLYLRVTDVEPYFDNENVETDYELRLKGFLGHFGEPDEVVACSW